MIKIICERERRGQTYITRVGFLSNSPRALNPLLLSLFCNFLPQAYSCFLLKDAQKSPPYFTDSSISFWVLFFLSTDRGIDPLYFYLESKHSLLWYQQRHLSFWFRLLFNCYSHGTFPLFPTSWRLPLSRQAPQSSLLSARALSVPLRFRFQIKEANLRPSPSQFL